MNPELVPVITFVGKSGTGKTTFLEQLIPVLKAQGLRIAVWIVPERTPIDSLLPVPMW